MKPEDAKQTSAGKTEENLGLAGKTARFFISSPLAPLLFISMMLMGILGLVMTPRQEDPQISVPMVDVFVRYQGASAAQVSTLAIQPLERLLSEIPGVKHVYSASMRGEGAVTVQFEVGEDMGPSLVKVNDKLDSNRDLMPPGVSPPMVKAKGIDDVPVVNLTLWSKDLNNDGHPDVDDGQLRMLAHSVMQNLKEIPDTGNSFVVGGRREQVRIEVLPEKLSGYGISLDQVAGAIQSANSEILAGGVESRGSYLSVTTGSFLQTAEDINRLVVGNYNGVPVYVHDVARVVQGLEDANQMVQFYTGPASNLNLTANGMPAVTIAIAKKVGSNGVTVANSLIQRAEDLKGSLIPSNVEVSVTRNYGQTANDKVNELIFKLFMATSFVFFLVLAAFRAFKPAIVVVLVIPVVLLMTVFAAWIMGFTIDRVSLFALIFSIGILVDDAIVVVENIYRRWLEEGDTDEATAVDAVREVGNPTILATFTVIAALMPMGFVSGMMGPYMMPIPALGSVAMLISLFAAFVFTPWLAISPMLRPTMKYLQVAEQREHKEAEWMEGLYRKLLVPLIESKAKRRMFRLIMWGSFLFACSFFYTKWVAVKMLPLDNKPEFAVVVDMHEGTALPITANIAQRIAEAMRTLPEVTAVQTYVGTARPFDFNGMVRHYYLRDKPWQGEVQVQLLDKTERKRSSHEIAVAARELVKQILPRDIGRFAVVEMPPGPPVLQSVVAEIHGPSPEVRRRFAQDMTRMFEQAESLRDVDNFIQQPLSYWRFVVDNEKAVRRGISVESINRNLSMALGGMAMGDVKQRAGHEPIEIVIQVPMAERAEITRLGDLPIQSQQGQQAVTIPLRELGRFEEVQEDDVIFHKDLRDVEFVVGDVGGELAAPVYGMIQIGDLLKDYVAPDGVKPQGHWIGPPPDDSISSFEWTGEWTVTYETFRDMGAAFMVALVLIYILVVWEFGNFRIPALIMAPIPLTLLGIIPMHWVMGAEFTATSMIGWIALAGIIVRNSILLVDFSVHEIQHGTHVKEAVIKACKTRTRPIMITALALVCGSSVIFTDPIFQGMAISLASGVMVSTILTLVVIPLGCIAASDSLCSVAGVDCSSREPQVRASSDSAPTSSKPEPSWLLGLWAKLIGLFTLVFYALRGVLLLLGQLFRRPAAAAPRTGSSTTAGPVTPQAEPSPAPAPAVAPAPAIRTEVTQAEPPKDQTADGNSPDQNPVSEHSPHQPEVQDPAVDASAAASLEPVPEPATKEAASEAVVDHEPQSKLSAKLSDKVDIQAAAAEESVPEPLANPATEPPSARVPSASQTEKTPQAAPETNLEPAPAPAAKPEAAATAAEAVGSPASEAEATADPAPARAKAPRKRSAARKKIRAKSMETKAIEDAEEAENSAAKTAKKGTRRGIRLKNIDDSE
jgi:multidrug efflux pump subunit AcrB